MNSGRLALRVLRVDRRSRVSAILTAVGVAVATGLVLLLVGLPFATQARADRSVWQEPSYQSGEDGSATLSLARSDDVIDGRQIQRIDVAPLGDPAAITLPPGVGALPAPGEALLSPELRKLVDDRPSSQLGDRFGEQAGVLGEEALAYPGQLVVLVGQDAADMPVTAFSQDGFATDGARADPLLQLLAGVGVVVLLVPSLVLVSSAARLTAARRERRLAALRLAGATPKQVVSMVAAETAIASVTGAIIGFAVSPGLHALARYVPWDGGTWQASDFTVPLGVSIPIVLAIPLLVLFAAVLGLRRVVRTPLGATSQHTKKPLHWWRLLPLPLAGLFFMFAISTAEEAESVVPVLGALALVIASAALVGPWVTSAIGGIFVRIWRKPSMLLAGRKLRDDPQGAYRASAGVVLAVFTGSMALTLLPSFESLGGSSSPFQDSVLYIRTDSGSAQRIAERANHELAAQGQRERASEIGEVVLTNGRSETGQQAYVLDCAAAEELLRLDMAGACAGQPGIYSPYTFSGDDLAVSAIWDGKATPLTGDVPVRPVTTKGEGIDSVPVIDPAVLPAGVLPEEVTVAVPTTSADYEVVRTALASAANGAQIESRATRLDSQDSTLADLRRVTVIGLLAAAVLGGCSAAIATAGSVLDRRKTFGALIAAGTPVNVLARALRTEAAMPAMVATIGAGVVGMLVGMGLYSLLEPGFVALSPWLLAPVVLGIGVAVLAASVCKPALKRVGAEPLAEE
ncbi:permease [Prauserella marina]|uniref:FtsX-like permease family protein n=1 Tax=Prauserella marina TaxID=530584 RepID=A0A222VXQ0_9PSEU|nr:ABC transporter permease [Prauserella marina]ASR38756.1 permease [Prauserella marina]PWV82110.1 FtsX-like permease family protein [Prauserella marina]SDD19586.1 FtsX-like permease family protein [Prauserella marina]